MIVVGRARAFAFAAFALAAGIALAPCVALARPDPAELTNRAIRQPMLAERITKLYTQAGQNILGARTARQLPVAMQDFEAGMKELLANAPNAEIRENYQLLEQLWGEYRAIASKSPSLDNARKLAEQNEEVVWISTKGAQLLQEQLRTVRGDLIRTAGDIRVLSQRIAKLYLFRSWGIRSGVIANDLKDADAAYLAAMAKLSAAPQNTPEIRAELALADNQYLFLGQAIARLNTGRNVPQELEFVAKTCDNILEVMDRVARLYEALGG